jgi:hypothetical protein
MFLSVQLHFMLYYALLFSPNYSSIHKYELIDKVLYQHQICFKTHNHEA